jgi:hypothetical protein
MGLSHQDRIDAGLSFDWDSLPPYRSSLDDLELDSTELRFRRERSSHRGIHRLKRLRRVWLAAVNQPFLEEIAEISTIEMLHVDGLTATDMSPLEHLSRLRHLILIGGTKVDRLDWVSRLPPLEGLALENFRRISKLDPISSLKSLSALAIEGSTWTAMRVDSLAPISELRGLRYFFFTNLRASDHSLRPLRVLTELKAIECGALFPDEQFVALHQALPELRCDWFDVIDQYGGTRDGIRAMVRDALGGRV